MTTKERNIIASIARIEAALAVMSGKIDDVLAQRKPTSLQERKKPVGPVDQNLVVERFRAIRNMAEVADEIGISRERVRQIIDKYEGISGELIPRVRLAQPKKRVRWECESCDLVIMRSPAVAAAAGALCKKCKADRRGIPIADLEAAVASIKAGEVSWRQLGRKLGLRTNPGPQAVERVIRFLIRHDRIADIEAIWPKGIPPYLARKLSNKFKSAA